VPVEVFFGDAYGFFGNELVVFRAVFIDVLESIFANDSYDGLVE